MGVQPEVQPFNVKSYEITELHYTYGNATLSADYNEGQKCWDTFIKWPLFEYWTYLSPSPVYLHPLPPKSMLYFGPSTLSFTSDNIDSGGEGIYGV